VKKLYGKIPHLPGSRLGPADRTADAALAARCAGAGRDGDRVIVSEKLDGSCVAIVREPDGGLAAYGRDGMPCAASRNDGRRAFAAWVEAQAAARTAWIDALAPGDRLLCEWMVLAHGTRYALPHGPAVAIDGFGADGARWPLDEVHSRAAAMALPIARVLHDGGALPVVTALALLGERGHHGALEPAEGVVYRVERAGKVIGLAKHVRAGKLDGCYLADHTGGDHVWNTWQDG
jgi:hypothetical protein